MRLEKPRIAPLSPDRFHPKTKKRFGDGEVGNIFKTLAHHPDLLERWAVFGNHVLFKSTLPPRDREIVVLRVGWLCQCDYEWGQHVRIGQREGLTEEEIARIPDRPEAPGWSEFERALLRAADELHSEQFLSDSTWATLAERYNVQQLMDVVFTVGQYQIVSMALNSLGVQLESGVPRLPQR